ncbi:translation initiation factor IF-2 [Coemansia sp. RSA 1365]|nr:translation initiation factor IF-2 [Coemansia sp. RSA 1365]
MYTFAKFAESKAPARFCMCDYRAWRQYSSASGRSRMQELLDMNRKKKSALDTWKRPSAAHTAPSKVMTRNPNIGGFSSSRPSPTNRDEAIPTFRSFLVRNRSEEKPEARSTDTQNVQRSPVVERHRPVQPRSTGFDATNPLKSRGTGVPSMSFSAAWGQKSKQASESAQALDSQPSKMDMSPKEAFFGTKEASLRATSDSSQTAAATGGLTHMSRGDKTLKNTQGSNTPSSSMPQLHNARETPMDRHAANITNNGGGQANAAQGTGRPDRLLERRRADIKHGLQKDTPKKESRDLRRGDSPRRLGRGGATERRDTEDQEGKRRKRIKLPKRGKEITLPLTITVDGLAKLLGVPNDHMLRKMRFIGMDKLANDYLLSNEEAADVALTYGVVPVIPEESGPELYPRPAPDDMSKHPLRPPVITIMGHVDHGKTTLLDTLRSSSITAGEAGGITQHIGAFSVLMKGGQNITFLDTPGHAAFSAMRARGANATDIVVLVVAADDGVMPQTKEAIQHAQDAGVPIIVAINKCDKSGVDPSLIQEELLQHGIQTENMGGDVQAVEISALKGDGVDELAENIATLAEVLDLRAEVDIPAEASVIESQVEKGRGNTASVLVKRGMLKVGDIIAAGTTWCKVRSMADDRGKPVVSAGPATAVKIMGWKEIPQAGDLVLQAKSEAQVKDVVANRIAKRKKREQLDSIEAVNEKRREIHVREDHVRDQEKAYKRAVSDFYKGLRPTHPRPLVKKSAAQPGATDVSDSAEIPVIPIIVKGDVSGTVEAVVDALQKIPDQKIKTSIISTGVGPVTASDVDMAKTADKCAIIAFNVKADKKTQGLAKRSNVEIMSFRIIYKLLEDVESLLLSHLPPIIIEEVGGEAVCQQHYEINGKGRQMVGVAGCRVLSGTILRTAKIRVQRQGKPIFMGDVSSLKNVKDDIKEATKGQEFGISLVEFDSVREGDVIQSLRYKEIPQKLE